MESVLVVANTARIFSDVGSGKFSFLSWALYWSYERTISLISEASSGVVSAFEAVSGSAIGPVVQPVTSTMLRTVETATRFLHMTPASSVHGTTKNESNLTSNERQPNNAKTIYQYMQRYTRI